MKLLQSVAKQSLYPAEIIIVDGSEDNATGEALESERFKGIRYFQVEAHYRGLTKQRNFGISKVADEIEIICFLDDDVILTTDYFEKLIDTYNSHPNALGVGGYILNEVNWHKKERDVIEPDEYEWDGWVRKLGSRNKLRKKLGMLSDKPPGIMPDFSNGLSISFLPPNNKVYPVEFFMGGVASYKRELFKQIKFSTYFENYGLYEDLDFCLRASKKGQLYLNTGAGLYHYHDASGRPDMFKYGKMVLRNGWYVWRIKYPNPAPGARLKWNLIALTLTLIRIGNISTTNKKREALLESMGRIAGWGSLIFNKPKIHRD